MRVTQNDILDAIRAATRAFPAGDGFTRPELARKLGVSTLKAGDVLRVMLAEGRAEIVTVQRPALDGRTMTLRGFRLKKATRAA